MSFGTSYTLSKVPESHIKSGDSMVDRVGNMKYLGVILEENLTFKDYVRYIKCKATSTLKMLDETRVYVNGKTSVQLYKTLINPPFYFDYVAPAYDCLTQKESYTL